MITTKDEERKALVKIKKIVEGLGENSYIATAFEGCFEVAESNIDNDFADSWKSSAESERKQADELKKQLEKANLDNRDLRNVIDNLKNKISSLEMTVKASDSRLLLADTQSELKCLVSDKLSDLRDELETAANAIIENADDPSSDKFIQAVKDHRSAKASIDYYEEILSEIEAKQHI